MKIYTKTGDDGSTRIKDGQHVLKSSKRIKSYGIIDEANSTLGIVLSNKIDDDIRNLLIKIQNELFVLGTDLSDPNKKTANNINNRMIRQLELEIDKYEKQLPKLVNFILPGGDTVSSFIHLTRTIIRRSETSVIELSQEEYVNCYAKKYLNRLSDLLFVLARVINKRNNIDDIIWRSAKL